MKKILIIFILSLFVMPGFFVFAQEPDDDIDPNDVAWKLSQPLDNGVDCFDYYKFQSVSVSVGSDQEVYQPGTEVHFSGFVANENDYPVVDGNLLVRIGKKNENALQEGQYIVDKFIAVKDIAIDARSQKNVEFSWTVPIYQSNGSYVVDYFFSVGKKFNLGGLPFSNEIVAGTANFDISSTIEDFVSFENSATTFNGEKYEHVSSWPVVEAGTEVMIKNVLRNSFDYEKSVNITHELYRWDSLNEEDKLDTQTMTITMPANATQEISYKVPETSGAVYFVRTMANYDENVDSVINTRFSTSNTERPRLNFPAITKFPVKKNDTFTLFSCFHNSTGMDANGTVHVVLLDKNDEIIGEVRHDGTIPSAMSAIKKDITVKQDYEYMKLKANITDAQGNVVDQYETVYDCAQFGNCTKNMGEKMTSGWMRIVAYILFVSVSLVIVFILVKILKKRRMQGMNVFFLGAVIMSGLFFGQNAFAVGDKSTSSSVGYNLYQSKSGGWVIGIATGTVSLNHNMRISSGNTSVDCNGAVTFAYTPTLTFNATGGGWDTPNGSFCSNYTSSSCFGGTIPKSGAISGSNGQPGYIYFTGNQPSVRSITSNNTGLMTCSGMTCTAVPGASGTARITATLNGSSTRVWALVRIDKDRCGTKNVPCSGSILGTSRCSGKYLWYSPTEDNFICGGGARSGGYSPSFKTVDFANNKTISWDITVGSCVTDGVCNPAATKNNYAYTATGPSTPLCSAGTPSPATVSFPSGAYGASSAVSWTCAGSGGGTTATCSAARLAPAASCGSANGVMTGIQPAVNLCGAGSVLVSPPGVTLNDTTWQWSCTHSINPGADPQTVNCSAPTPSTPCACNPAETRTDYPYTATGPTTPLCSSPGTPFPALVSFPVDKYGVDSVVTWTCSDVNCMGTANCTAQRNFPSIDCGTANGTTEYNNGPPTNLCPPEGSAVAPDHSTTPPIPRFVNGEWQWACQHNTITSIFSDMCSAPTCITGRPITATTPVIINRDNDQHTVVSVSCPNLCCEITRNGQPIDVTICTNGTSSAEIQIPAGGANLESICWFDNNGDGDPDDPGDTPETPGNTVAVQTACTARSCNTQHTCQATAQIADNLDDCSSTCNSDSDCSSGRMIETRP